MAIRASNNLEGGDEGFLRNFGYSLWIMFQMNFGTFGPGIQMRRGSHLLFATFFLKGKMTFTMNRAILLSKTTMIAICDNRQTISLRTSLGCLQSHSLQTSC